MNDVVLDTDVASLVQRERAPAWIEQRLVGARVWFTFVTVGELAKWAVVRKWGGERRDDLSAWVSSHGMIPFRREIAAKWGELAGNAQLRGRPRPQNDTWVAACCLVHELPLLSLNVQDFRDFVDHEGLVLITEESAR